MIGRIVGKVVAEDIDGTVTVDVAGVGYDIKVPVGVLARAEKVSAGVILVVHTHVREDTLELFGFASDLERKVFRLLLDVHNVGPKLALGVMSALPPPELAAALDKRDIVRLNKISGVGKKTAERLVLELREKLPKVAKFEQSGVPAILPKDDRERLIGALTNMGYKAPEAEKAVEALGARVGKESLSELLRGALQQLGP